MHRDLTQMNLLTEAHVEPAGPHLFTAEASELEHTRKGWPTAIPTNMGNGQPFIRSTRKVDGEGDTLWVTYRQEFGCLVLRVFND